MIKFRDQELSFVFSFSVPKKEHLQNAATGSALFTLSSYKEFL